MEVILARFEATKRATLKDGDFPCLLGRIITADVCAAAQTLRNMDAFELYEGEQ